MARVILRFTRNNSLVSRAIRLLTWSKYSHVEFVLNEGYLGALGNGGVQIRSFGYAPDNEYVMRGIEVSTDVYQKVIAFAMRQIGKPYDWSGVFGIACHRDWHNRHAWFCSELVAAAFEDAGHELIRSNVDRVTPQDLFNLEEVRP